ncbi:MAG: hypothetical protein RBS80_22655 [Thermoguttaceae bacterium]|jgi:hypothetical protein|nr:hypothetical protein [Thermoguttaceae bacterium]
MSEAGARGPQVDASEDLYRFITTPSFWVAGENRPSSAAFDHPPPISVNVASLTTVEETTRQLREDLEKPLGGIISVGCGRARGFGFDARHEPEKNNLAHAHLYYDGSNNSRKKNARRLVEQFELVLQPQFQ